MPEQRIPLRNTHWDDGAKRTVITQVGITQVGKTQVGESLPSAARFQLPVVRSSGAFEVLDGWTEGRIRSRIEGLAEAGEKSVTPGRE